MVILSEKRRPWVARASLTRHLGEARMTWLTANYVLLLGATSQPTETIQCARRTGRGAKGMAIP